MIRRLIKVGIVAALVIGGYFAVTFVQVWAATGATPPGRPQAIIVLGAAQYNGRPSPVLKARLDHAAELYEAKIAPVVVLTGGGAPATSSPRRRRRPAT